MKTSGFKYFLLLSLLLPAMYGCSGKTIAAEDKENKNSSTKPIPKDEDGNEVDNEAPTNAQGADAAVQKSEEPSAAQVADQSKEFYRKFYDARKHHDFSAANQVAGEILSRNPNDTRVLNSLAVMAIEQEKYELARLFIDKVLAKDPNNGMAYNNLGVIELKTDDLRLALVQFKKAIAFDVKNKAAHANLGTIYLKYRNYQNAAQELTEAVENGDQSPDTLSNLGFALSGTGNFQGASQSYEKALAKDPNNISIMLNYSTLLVERTHKYKDAIKLLNKIRFIAREPAILDKVEILLKKAENPAAKPGVKPDPEKGVSE